jgi:hypothetical protein
VVRVAAVVAHPANATMIATHTTIPTHLTLLLCFCMAFLS